MAMSWSKTASGSLASRRQIGERAVPRCALGREGPAADPGEGGVVGGDEAGTGAHFDGEVAQRQPAFDRHGADHCAGIFHRMAAGPGDADLGDDAERHVLGADVIVERAVEPDAHALRPLGRKHLGRQHMLELGGADREGERAEAADGAGMAVGHRMGRARQHHAQFRRHHVGDALLGVAEIEDADAVAAAALAHGAQERGALGIGGVVAPGRRGDGVILHGEGEIGPPHRPVGLGELLECMGTVQLMQHVPVDIDEIAAIGAARHEMGIPYLVEQCLRHGWFRYRGAGGVEHGVELSRLMRRAQSV